MVANLTPYEIQTGGKSGLRLQKRYIATIVFKINDEEDSSNIIDSKLSENESIKIWGFGLLCG
jgi:hypothetical protein